MNYDFTDIKRCDQETLKVSRIICVDESFLMLNVNIVMLLVFVLFEPPAVLLSGVALCILRLAASCHDLTVATWSDSSGFWPLW